MKRNSLWSILSALILTVSFYGYRAHADSSDDLEPLTPDVQTAVSAPPQAENPIPVADDSVTDTQKINNASNKTDELELNNDVEGLEQYGDAATAQTAKAETARLAKENKRLERRAGLLKQRREFAAAKAKRLETLYKKQAIEAVLVRKKADHAAYEARRAQRAVDQLQARVDFKKTLIARASHSEVQALKRIAMLKRANRQLQFRLARVERFIKLREKRLRHLRGVAHRLSKNHRRLVREIARAQ